MMKHVLVLNGDTMGRGDDELGGRLLVKFVHQLTGVAQRPDGILFYNTGVRLLGPASVVADTLAELEHAGVELLACGTCVEQFGLVGQTRAGRVTDMREIASVLTGAERVVTI
jgi:hypothetical protein